MCGTFFNKKRLIRGGFQFVPENVSEKIHSVASYERHVTSVDFSDVNVASALGVEGACHESQ